MKKYCYDDYLSDIDKKGLKKTWDYILDKVYNDELESNDIVIDNFGELYEIGLARVNKVDKKEAGKYYTPVDVANVMSKWLINLKGDNICDVACGTGNLILSYLKLLNKNDVIDLLENKKIFLYDMDEIALKICKYIIAIKYGKEYIDNINIKKGDFLRKNIKLPLNSKVISNPPYYKITDIDSHWICTKNILNSREYYSAFMEKIMKQSVSSVIITPYSFIGSNKFYELRKMMNTYSGFIVSFDNVPGNIFNGRKHGVFNSNTGNSVRAAITVVNNSDNVKGFRISPLLRFKTEERTKMLNNDYLESTLNDRYQLIDSKQKSYYKCSTDLLEVLDKWEALSDNKMSSLINSKEGKIIYVPTTCRYFTVGAVKKLERDGKRELYISNLEYYNYVYCMLNSTFAYWYWRLYDGGINCPLTIINNIPVFYNLFSKKQKLKLDKIAKEMQSNEEKFLSYKVNAGKKQENIKFPLKYRKIINELFFEVLNIKQDINILDQIHSSALFDIKEGDNDE